MTTTIKNIALVSAVCALLAACGEPTETAEAPPPEASATEPTPAPTIATEPPVSRQPDIPPPSAHIALNPGLYQAEGVELELSALRFELDIPAESVAAEGSYEVVNGVLNLAATAGEMGNVEFPLECRLTRVGPAIAFDDVEDGSCGVLAGLRFQRETRTD